MKIQVTQENLSRALNNVAKVASNRGTLPILSNVLIKTVDNRVCIAATNLNIAITHYIGSKVAEAGSITVPARLMQDFVASLPSGIIGIHLDDTKLHIKTDQHNSVINGTPSDDYPIMPKITDGKTWKIPATELKNSLTQVIIAASNDDARPVLTGINLHSQNGTLYFVATDSYRLAEKKSIKLKDEINIIIPSSAAADLLRILDDSDDPVHITNDGQQILFSYNDVELVSRLIDGKFPDYKKLMPSEFKTSATLPKPEMANITKVSSLFARESAGSVTLEVDEAGSKISINSIASQLGENAATANAQAKGTGQITLNSRYIMDALNVINSDEVLIGFNEKLEPFVLKGTGDDTYQHIIMPLKS